MDRKACITNISVVHPALHGSVLLAVAASLNAVHTQVSTNCQLRSVLSTDGESGAHANIHLHFVMLLHAQITSAYCGTSSQTQDGSSVQNFQNDNCSTFPAAKSATSG
eukprot:TRINITY_DN8537_c0_g2_i1.p2 TRINITY_DN8537_c0_g2~~TRINITY_DN8537_c0_g2_i1.p2  ORF type:complete len:108 (+),score=0.67 TRINITY_DN8537_c0_g2_i1:257-580(+)